MGSNSFENDLVELYETKTLYINALMGEFGSSRFIEKLKTQPNLNMPELNLPDGHPLKPYLVEFHLSISLSLFRLWLRRGQDLPVSQFIGLIADLYQGGLSSTDWTDTKNEEK